MSLMPHSKENFTLTKSTGLTALETEASYLAVEVVQHGAACSQNKVPHTSSQVGEGGSSFCMTHYIVGRCAGTAKKGVSYGLIFNSS